jgi:hypothetical protein
MTYISYEQYWKNVQVTLYKRGYLVVACAGPKEIGDIYTRDWWPESFQITAQTDFDDWAEQAPITGYPKPTEDKKYYYYRMITNDKDNLLRKQKLVRS